MWVVCSSSILKMKLAIFISCVLIPLLAQSCAALTCYECSGNATSCPKYATATELESFDKVDCTSVLSTVCAKYSIDLLNGEAYTYRACEPTYVGGTSASGVEFCPFINSLYAPLVNEGLIAGSSCYSCNSIDCNT